MKTWAKSLARYVNVSTATALMGIMWLYLWLFPWYEAYEYDPRWGHNYAEALAFLAVGLAFFNNRFISHILSFLAALLIIPASLELFPTPVTAIAGGALVLLIIVDIIVERGRKTDLAQPSNRRITFWWKRHLPRFAYIMLGHLALVYFIVRLPSGTYETELVTKVYDGMLIPFVIIALMEDSVKTIGGVPTARLGFFWGMAAVIISLILLISDPATWPVMVVALLFSAVAIVSLVQDRKAQG